MKKALITGITGMVGSHLADYLFENTDWDIHGMIRWNDDMKNIIRKYSYRNKNKTIALRSKDGTITTFKKGRDK